MKPGPGEQWPLLVGGAMSFSFKVKAGSSSFARIGKGENISMDLLDRICTVLDCSIEAVIRHEKESRTGEGEAL